MELRYFNSIKVRLEPKIAEVLAVLQRYFNSIKVRLELAWVLVPRLTIQFQFHKGAIRTCVRYRKFLVVVEFQFHKGAIRTQSANHSRCCRHYFNSIKVRLELPGLSVDCYPTTFQFHKGAIRTFITICMCLLALLFQFHKGAIRT